MPSVVVTSQAIEDEAAVEFAARFYRAMGAGAAVQRAFNEAAAAVALGRGKATRDFFRDEPGKSEGLPWHLRIAQGAELAADWSLPEAAGDPLFGLPPLAHRDLPENPFLEPLAWYTSEYAEVFFGRGYQIRELFEQVANPGRPRSCCFTGVRAWASRRCLPRGCSPGSRPLATPRGTCAGTQQKGLLATLREGLGPPGGPSGLGNAWRAAEAALGQPLIVVLDQVEESLTHSDDLPTPDRPGELGELIAALAEVFVRPDDRPHGKLVLGFRMEWLAVIERRLSEARLPRAKMFLEPLDRRGIIEAVRGPGRLTAPPGREVARPVISSRIEVQYRLEIADDLPGLIADDLLHDRDSLVAPTLQILLSAMWEKARETDAASPRFDRTLYEDLRRKGILLGDFLHRQLTNLRLEARRGRLGPGPRPAGVLHHTPRLGVGAQRGELAQAYGHIGPDLPALLQRCNDLYLLTDLGRGGECETPVMRLAHDTLAPLVRERYDRSDLPAQRARRILRSRLPEWERGREGAALEEHDLAVVERAEGVMRARSGDELRLVEASRRARRPWRPRPLPPPRRGPASSPGAWGRPAPQPPQDIVPCGPGRRVAAEQVDAQRGEVVGQVGHQLAGRWRVEPLFVHHDFYRAAQERQPPGQRLVEHHTHAVPVAGRRDLHARRLLRRHVGGRSQRVPLGGLSQLLATQVGNQPEVEEYDPAPRRHQHVRRLDVAVQLARVVYRRDPPSELQESVPEAPPIGRRERLGSLGRPEAAGLRGDRRPAALDFRRRQPGPSQVIGRGARIAPHVPKEVGSLDQLHDDVPAAVMEDRARRAAQGWCGRPPEDRETPA